MFDQWTRIRATVPPPFLAAIILALGFGTFAAWDQSHWWRQKEDYSFGWIVPLFVLYVSGDRWPKIVAELANCSRPQSPRVCGWRRWLVVLLTGSSLAVGVVLFALGATFRATVGTSQPGTLAITSGMITIVLPLLLISAPCTPSAERSGIFSDARLRLVGLFLFPALVWLISAPLVSAIESQVKLSLLRRVVSVVAFVFDTLGLPIEQQGNVLSLPPVNGRPNQVGVEDACSGIRSLTACLFAGSFLAAVFLDRIWKKVALVAAALFLAVATNLGRSLFLTAWAYHYGHAAISGTVHDAAGYAVLVFTVTGLLCLLPLFNLRLAPARSASGAST